MIILSDLLKLLENTSWKQCRGAMNNSRGDTYTTRMGRDYIINLKSYHIGVYVVNKDDNQLNPKFVWGRFYRLFRPSTWPIKKLWAALEAQHNAAYAQMLKTQHLQIERERKELEEEFCRKMEEQP